MTSEQKTVLKGMMAAIVVVFATFGYAYWVESVTISVGVAIGFLMLPLALEIGALAKMHFTHADVLAGTAYDVAGSETMMSHTVLQNTLEQTVLAAGTYIALGVALPIASLSLLAPATGLFIVGRTLFFFGYRHGASVRAFGFGLTFYPTLALLILFLSAFVPF